MIRQFKPGDEVGSESWGTDTETVDTVDSENYPDDPVVFFLAGGFWRSSRLFLVMRPGGEELCA